MARGIKISDIGGYFDDQVQKVVRKTTFSLFQIMRATEARSSSYGNGVGTPVETSTLIQGWQQRMDNPYQGRVFNAVVYAAPVMYGENLPPSWGGKYRTKQGTKKEYPDLIAKEVSRTIVPKIVRQVSKERS